MSHRPYKPKDHFFQKAHAQGLRARSAFKLEEIAKRFNLFRKGQAVLDLGAAPGGFLQIIADQVGDKGRVVGIDIVAIRPFNRPNVVTAVLDVFDDKFEDQLKELHSGTYDVVVSDMAPKTSGIRSTDEARSLNLATRALDLSKAYGKPGSHFVAKLFMGGDFELFRKSVREAFEDVKIVRPEATRGSSVEVYVAGLKRRGS